MGRREDQGPQAAHPLVLPEPCDLLCQQDRIDQLHHLRRLDTDGDMGDFQPGEVARIVVYTEPAQQGDESQPKQEEQPPPPLEEPLQVHVGHYKIGSDSQQGPDSLNNHPAHLVCLPPVAGGAGDKHQPEGRADEAQSQQLHIRSAEHILNGLKDPFEKGHGFASKVSIACSLPHQRNSVNCFCGKIIKFQRCPYIRPAKGRKAVMASQ